MLTTQGTAPPEPAFHLPDGRPVYLLPQLEAGAIATDRTVFVQDTGSREANWAAAVAVAAQLPKP